MRQTFKLLPNICQLLVDALLFEFSGSRVPEIGDKLDKPSHVGITTAGAAQESGRAGRRHGCGCATRLT